MPLKHLWACPSLPLGAMELELARKGEQQRLVRDGWFPVGRRVRLIGLLKSAGLNGRFGTVISPANSEYRVAVAIDGIPKKKLLLIDNLDVVELTEAERAAIER